MRSPVQTAFAAVFQNELILNSKRIAPYALVVLFAANAVLWWGWSAAATYGWATNGDFNIVRNFQGFSFILGLPLFNALIMGDPVVRDFNTGIDSLIFSKPVSRVSYLLGKFTANFFVLVCCMGAFMLTGLLLQLIPLPRLVVFPVRVFPYFKHFFLILVISHMLLAAVFFTLATLKRNVKIAYAAAVAFYPLYFAYQLLFLRNLSPEWRVVLDPMMLSAFQVPRDRWVEVNSINQMVIDYSSGMIANRALVVVLVALIFVILYFRFTITEEKRSRGEYLSLNLSTARGSVRVDREMFPIGAEGRLRQVDVERRSVVVPAVSVVNEGVRAHVRKLIAATRVELTLLRHEKSLTVLLPLSILISFLSLPFSSGVANSGVFAGSSVRGLSLFLLGMIVFYVGESMHRDREVRMEPVLWSSPANNNVLLLSKFFAVLLLSILLMILGGLTAMLTQFVRGETPVALSTYLAIYTVILIPSLIFMAAASIALNVFLRDKYLCYAVTIAIGSALIYLYSQGFNHWLYNPVLYGLWSESDFASWERFSYLMWLRMYSVAIAAIGLVAAHIFFERRSN